VSLPRTVLIDRDGSVAGVDLRGDRLADTIRALISRSTPPAAAGER
jgi:hypothetical protein